MRLSEDHNDNGRDGLSVCAFDVIRQMIHDYCGIHFEDSKRYLLENRVHQRMQVERIRTHAQYVERLRSEGANGELARLVDAVTINETYFFRHEPQLELLERSILPEIIRTKSEHGVPRLRLWSAGCSSGDEAYSLAIIAREKLQPAFPRAIIEIVATDIDHGILAAARRGTYSEYAVRNVPEPLKRKYFTVDNGRYVLDAGIRNMVRFRHLNLFDSLSMRSMRDFDVVLCANVLIYFDPAAKKKVLDSIHKSLNPGGYLFIGFSETLFGLTDQFVPIRRDRSFVYQKQEPGAIGRTSEASLAASNRPA